MTAIRLEIQGGDDGLTVYAYRAQRLVTYVVTWHGDHGPEETFRRARRRLSRELREIKRRDAEREPLRAELRAALSDRCAESCLRYLDLLAFHGAGTSELRGIGDSGLDAETLRSILMLCFDRARELRAANADRASLWTIERGIDWLSNYLENDQ